MSPASRSILWNLIFQSSESDLAQAVLALLFLSSVDAGSFVPYYLVAWFLACDTLASDVWGVGSAQHQIVHMCPGDSSC